MRVKAAAQNNFPHRVQTALGNEALQRALGRARTGFQNNRRRAVNQVAEFQRMRSAAREIKNHTLAHLDFYLEQFADAVRANGGQVHWARTAGEARDTVAGICSAGGGGKKIAKGKTMVAEEIELNPALEKAGHEVTETDLGEYIVQLAGEAPSHIIAPAVHKTRGEVLELFARHHGAKKRGGDTAAIVAEARQVLREKFTGADIGITGANFLIAETGAIVLVTNEGNGDLCSCLPPVHIVTAAIEKVLPTLEDLALFLRLLGRSATGQEISNYTTLYAGAKREADTDGPREFHLVLLDNGRSAMLGGEFRDMLRCIRCGACLNHCPVYGSIGGHAYDAVYSGPMGAVLTPLSAGLRAARDLPNACTLNGRCREVCPVDIPLPDLLRKHRMREFEQKLGGARGRLALALWAFFALRPRLYQAAAGALLYLLKKTAGRRGALRKFPLAGGWTQSRDLPAPEGKTFLRRWAQGER